MIHFQFSPLTKKIFTTSQLLHLALTFFSKLCSVQWDWKITPPCERKSNLFERITFQSIGGGATIIGLVLGIGLIGGSMFLAGLNYGLSIGNFWNLESMMIVLGGTLSATAIAFRLNEVKRVFGLIGFADDFSKVKNNSSKGRSSDCTHGT